jgi:hypothetical protein
MPIGYVYIISKEDVDKIYVGSTVDVAARKSHHEGRCNGTIADATNLKVYVFIREHGGWSEWKFDVIEEYEYEDVVDLRKREQYHMDMNKDKLLNTAPAYTTPEQRKARKKIADAKRHARYWADEEKREELKEKNRQKHQEKGYNRAGNPYYERSAERRKEWAKANKDKVKEYKRRYLSKKNNNHTI